MNDYQWWESLIDLLTAATEDLDPVQRKTIGRRICDELATNPKFCFLPNNIWHSIDPTVVN